MTLTAHNSGDINKASVDLKKLFDDINKQKSEIKDENQNEILNKIDSNIKSVTVEQINKYLNEFGEKT